MNLEQNPQPQQPSSGQQPTLEPPAQTVELVNPIQASPQTQPPQQHGQPKQPKKLLLVIVVAIIVLVGLVVAVSQILNKDKSENTNQSTVVPQDDIIEQANDDEASTPSVDQAQLDTQRKNSAAKLIVAISEYSANNNGKFPTASSINSVFIDQYLGGSFNDPEGNSYGVVETDPMMGEVQYKTTSTCGSGNIIIIGKSRQVAVRVLLSDGTYYCTSN